MGHSNSLTEPLLADEKKEEKTKKTIFSFPSLFGRNRDNETEESRALKKQLLETINTLEDSIKEIRKNPVRAIDIEIAEAIAKTNSSALNPAFIKKLRDFYRCYTEIITSEIRLSINYSKCSPSTQKRYDNIRKSDFHSEKYRHEKTYKSLAILFDRHKDLAEEPPKRTLHANFR